MLFPANDEHCKGTQGHSFPPWRVFNGQPDPGLPDDFVRPASWWEGMALGFFHLVALPSSQSQWLSPFSGRKRKNTDYVWEDFISQSWRGYPSSGVLVNG